MKKEKGITFTGRLRSDGITIYQKQGKTIIRSSSRRTSKGFTIKQFIQRQRMRHAIALWRELEYCYPMFTEAKSAYNGFVSLANRLPAVFVAKRDAMDHPSFLMPGIPVSDGTLPELKQRLGEVDGKAALITNLKRYEARYTDTLKLFVAEQTNEDNIPRVNFRVRNVLKEELVETENGMALVGEEFSDDNKGWALVLVIGDSCSSQSIVTRCKFYEQFTTEELMNEAAKTYGRVKKRPYLSPGR
ncbi:MAG: hypothetical protein J6X51_01400 [Bacteroidales bacterium]|nr:hypothetical protein [Bacteroidales bacterium]